MLLFFSNAVDVTAENEPRNKMILAFVQQATVSLTKLGRETRLSVPIAQDWAGLSVEQKNRETNEREGAREMGDTTVLLLAVTLRFPFARTPESALELPRFNF